jgi:hypothetical protein
MTSITTARARRYSISRFFSEPMFPYLAMIGMPDDWGAVAKVE